MRYKCKFCGYRFKDRDERICPECFTAREDDISCGQFSDDLHSHEIFGDRYSRNDYGSSENDTFKEERISFVEEERREEQQSKIAKLERMHNSQPIQTEFIPQSGDSVYNTSDNLSSGNNNISYGGFPRQNVNQFQRMPNGFTVPSYNRNNNRKKNSGCSVSIIVIIILIIVVNVIVTIIGATVKDDHDYESYDYNDNYYEEENKGFSNYTTETQYSSYKDYYLDQEYYNAYYNENMYLDDEKHALLQLGDDTSDDSLNDYVSSYLDEPVYNIYTSYTLQVSEGSKGYITDVVCVGSMYNGDIISTYTAPQSELMQYGDIMDDEINITPQMICSAEAEIIDITVTVNYDGEDEKFTFRLDLDSDE